MPPSPCLKSVTPRPVRILLVDADELARERTLRLIRSMAAADLVDAVAPDSQTHDLIVQARPDLLLLSVGPHDATAFDVLAGFPICELPLFAFVSSSEIAACRAYELGAIDYILRPFDSGRLEKMIERAATQLAMRRDAMRLLAIEAGNTALAHEERLEDTYVDELWVNGFCNERVRISVDSLEWVKAQDDYACLLANGREHLLRLSLTRLTERLDPQVFVRIHRSAIVRRELVTRVVRQRSGTKVAILRDGSRLPIGRAYGKGLDPRHI